MAGTSTQVLARRRGAHYPGGASIGRPVADPVPGAGTEAGGAVAGVGELAAVEREAAAADALREPAFEALELGDAPVDPRAPGG